MDDLFNIAVVKKEPHIVFNVPNAETNDTAVWEPKIKPRKTPQLRKLDEGKMQLVEK